MRVVLMLLVAVAMLLAVVGLLWSQQRRLIYLPAPRAVPPAATVLPAAEEVSFPTEDGLRLAGWFVPPAGTPGRGSREPRPPAVLVCNGNAGNRSLRAPLAAALARAGLAMLLFDYRGYAANPGRPTEPGRHLYPCLPVSLLLADRYDSLGRVGRLAAPLLVVAGERDRIIPAAHSRRLFDAAPKPKRFVLLAGADHNDLDLLAGPRLLAELLAFLRDVGALGAARGP